MQAFQPYVNRHLSVRLAYTGMMVVLIMGVRDLITLGTIVFTTWLLVVAGTAHAGRRYAWRMLMLPLVLFILNPLFNQRGQTVLLLIGNKRFTLEAIQMGAYYALQLYGVLLLFQLFRYWFQRREMLRLSSRFLPRVALLISLALSFVPRLEAQAEEVRIAQLSLGDEARSRRNRIHMLSDRLFILLNWALEDGLAVARTLTTKGYGLPHKATSAHSQPFLFLDAMLLLWLCIGAIVGTVAWVQLPAVAFYPVYGGWVAQNSSVWGVFMSSWLAVWLQPVVFSLWYRRRLRMRGDFSAHLSEL